MTYLTPPRGDLARNVICLLRKAAGSVRCHVWARSVSSSDKKMVLCVLRIPRRARTLRGHQASPYPLEAVPAKLLSVLCRSAYTKPPTTAKVDLVRLDMLKKSLSWSSPMKARTVLFFLRLEPYYEEERANRKQSQRRRTVRTTQMGHMLSIPAARACMST